MVGFGNEVEFSFLYKTTTVRVLPVLIHGLNESSLMWQGWKGNEVFRNAFCPDLPGFAGNQELPEFEVSMAGYAEWLNFQLLKFEGPFLLVGHSMGGYLALEYLSRHAVQVKGIVLVNSYASADTEQRKRNREQAIALLGKNPEAYFRMFLASLFEPEPEWLKRPEGKLMCRQMEGLNPEFIQRFLNGLKERRCHKATVAKWKSLVHYVYGSADAMLDSEMLEKEIMEVGAQGLCIRGKGHMLPWQAQEEVQVYISKQFDL